MIKIIFRFKIVCEDGCKSFKLTIMKGLKGTVDFSWKKIKDEELDGRELLRWGVPFWGGLSCTHYTEQRGTHQAQFWLSFNGRF